MYKLLIFVIGCANFGLAACGVERIPGIYRIDIQQGNVVTQDMLAKLKPGMSKEQVGFVLGSPLLVDTFQPDRWHYIYSFKPGNRNRTQRTIIVWFEDDKLTHISGDVELNAQIETEKRDRTVSLEVLPPPTRQSFLSNLIGRLGFGKAEEMQPNSSIEARPQIPANIPDF
jgi:outer membrane protein assembly factor BamE